MLRQVIGHFRCVNLCGACYKQCDVPYEEKGTEFRKKASKPEETIYSESRIVAASIAFSIRHKFEPDFPCLSHSLCLLCFDVPLFSVVLARLALYL